MRNIFSLVNCMINSIYNFYSGLTSAQATFWAGCFAVIASLVSLFAVGIIAPKRVSQHNIDIESRSEKRKVLTKDIKRLRLALWDINKIYLLWSITVAARDYEAESGKDIGIPLEDDCREYSYHKITSLFEIFRNIEIDAAIFGDRFCQEKTSYLVNLTNEFRIKITEGYSSSHDSMHVTGNEKYYKYTINEIGKYADSLMLVRNIESLKKDIKTSKYEQLSNPRFRLIRDINIEINVLSDRFIRIAFKNS